MYLSIQDDHLVGMANALGVFVDELLHIGGVQTQGILSPYLQPTVSRLC